MKFAIAKEHYDLFHREGMIEFEGLLSPAQLHTLQNEISNLLKQRIGLSDRGIPLEEAQNLYHQGRNLWQHSGSIQKIILHKRFADIAAALTDASFVRFGYDQLIPSGYEPAPLLTLEEQSCLQGVLCGALFCLSPPETQPETSIENEEKPTIFSQTAGNVIFFRPDLIIDSSPIAQKNNSSYLMAIYAKKKTVYIHNESDPNMHSLKALGYTFGDRLNDTLNPVLVRS